MFAVVIGALIGFLIGRLPGLLIGAGLGYAVNLWLRRKIIGGLQNMQTGLVESTFSVMGALCKADRVVTRDEIRTVEQIFTMLRLSPELREQAKAAFNRGKQPEFDLDAAVDRFARIARGQPMLVRLFLQLQTMAVAADGRVDPAEHAMLVRVAQRLGLGERDVAQLEALLRAASAGPSAPGAPVAGKRLEDAYAALGVSPDASDEEVKRAYRRLISQNHPDKLASRGLPESMRAVAEERSREINTAYDIIKEARKNRG